MRFVSVAVLGVTLLLSSSLAAQVQVRDLVVTGGVRVRDILGTCLRSQC